MVKIIKTLGTLYLSFIALHTIAAMPADAEDEKADDNEEDTTSVTPSIEPYSQRQKCKPNTNSCKNGYSCIRFNSDKEDEYSCIKTELAFCESGEYCQTNLGTNFKFCYQPPWNKNTKDKPQCFTEQNAGSHCLYDYHCVNNLICDTNNNICISSRVGDLEDVSTGNYDFEGKSGGSGTILGINKWVFIGAVSFPVVVLFFCMWCWLIGRSSSKAIERKKKERYEKEIKELTIPQTKEDNAEGQTGTPKLTSANAQKEIEEEVGKRTFKSLFSKKKSEADIKTKNDTTTKEESIDISTTKVGGNAPINTTTTSDTQQKMKKNLSLASLEEKGEKEKGKSTTTGNTRTPKKATKTPSTPGTSSAASLAVSSGSTAGKPRGTKKKAATGAKKNNKKTSSSTGNDTNTNSTSSKQSSQRGLVNNAANLSSALSGQSASYFSGVTAVDPQSALYYQQMYSAAAAQAAAAQNPYYASYLQNPYYAAAAAQNAAYYAQDPNLMYGTYPNTTTYQ